VSLIFAGTPEFARVALEGLLKAGYQFSAVYTQPDRPSGRGMQLTPSPVKQLALEAGIPVEQPVSLKKTEAQAKLASYSCDLMIVAAYGLLLPQAVLDMPRLGCINIHASLLPRWRGAAPIVRCIEAGDEETGICIMGMEAGLDTGPVYARHAIKIGATENAQQLHDRLAQLGAAAMVDVMPRLLANEIVPQVQSEEGVIYAHKLAKTESAIDWTLPASVLANRIRAFDPFPGVTTVLSMPTGDKLLKLWSAAEQGNEQANSPTLQPGAIVHYANDHFCVATGAGTLQIHAAQLPGAKRLHGQAMMQSLKAPLNLVGKLR
jgi:methionyl-tRNA formyltransferase